MIKFIIIITVYFEMLLIKKTKVKKNKSKSKKHRTFTSSEFSILQDQRQLSIHELFRNDAFKKRQPPAVLATAPVKKNKSQKYLQTTKKRVKSKSKLRLDKCQTYEVIPYKNSLNSEIVFSNQDTRREGSIHDSSLEQIAIKVNQEYLIDNNRQLRINIKKQYQKKVQAALKIQKVFRGFLTRRVLQNCLDKEQKKLQQKLAQIRSQSISQHSSYFAQKQIIENKKKNISGQNQGIFQYSYHNNDEKQSQQSQQIGQHVIYRRHEPIYSQDEISGYLESSQEQDFDQDAFDNHIIFETNQEYIDSRKSSLQQQQPKNKLSKTIYQDPIAQEPPETPSNHMNLDESLLTKTQKKQDRQRGKLKIQQCQQVKNDTLKLHEDISKSNSNIHQFLQSSQYDATIKQKQMLKISRKHELTAKQLIKLKEQEAKRWSQIINLVQFQITKPNIDNSEVSTLMKQIMELSIKNKQLLQLIDSPKNSQSQSSILSEKSLPHLDSRGKIKNIKAQRHYLSNMEICINEQQQQDKITPYRQFKNRKIQNSQKAGEKKKENVVLSQKASFFSQLNEMQQKKHQQQSNMAVNPISPLSSFENTDQLKKFLSGNVQDQYIEQMLKLRQQLMKKRELQDMKQLNNDLQNKKIEQGQFFNRLDKINQKYQLQKANIQKAKQDINKGHKAALKLTKEAVCDAKKFGYKLPISRSVEGLRFKSPLLMNDIIIDELVERNEDRLKRYQPPFPQRQFDQRIHIDIGSQQDSSELQFTQQQLKRFRRAQPYDIDIAEQIADLGRNVMITEQLIRQQKMQDENNLLVTQNFNRQIYQIEEISPRISNNPQAQLISQWLFQNIIWEASGQFMIKPLFSERLVDKNHFSKPKSITDKERLRFIELLEKNFPSSQRLNNKLNQKICPLPGQLLKCMRIDFTEDDDQQNSYEQIGKYQFIIGQDICNEAIKKFRQQIDEQYPSLNPSLQEIQSLGKEYMLNQKLFRYLQQRQKYICNRKNHTKQLRWEVLNIQIHCIFDAWNEQLIYLRSQKAGYSGVGLNQLTLSVKDHNFIVPLQNTLSIVAQGKSRLLKNMSLSSPALIFPMVFEQNENQILENDSKWIFYADQALSYALQLVYLIDQQIFSEMAKQLRKKMLQFY